MGHSAEALGATPPPAPDDVFAACAVVPALDTAAPLVVPDEGCAELCVPPVTEAPDVGADGACEPLTCPGETMVRAGTSRGSVPQDGEVVMPPVALSEIEHGMPRSFSAGSMSAADEFAPEDGGTPTEPAAAGLPVCASADPKAARRIPITGTNLRTNIRVIALSRRSCAGQTIPTGGGFLTSEVRSHTFVCGCASHESRAISAYPQGPRGLDDRPHGPRDG